MTLSIGKLSTALKLTTALVVVTAAPVTAYAAECFDRQLASPKAGNATAVIGPEVGRRAMQAVDFARPRAGEDIFTGDRVRTGSASHLQLKLCDWSTYSFPPESESRISEFYDPDGAMRRRLVNYVRGGFRLASGRNTQPGSTEVQIQESGVTMGVRGTNVILVELDGYVYALLEGPALDNTGYTPQGRVEFWTGENRNAIEARLIRPGWVVRIGPDGVSEPFRADSELLARIYEAFLPAVPDDIDDYVEYDGDPQRSSGQGDQEGSGGIDVAKNENEQEDETTENYPEQPSLAGITPEDLFDRAFPINVGDILPLDALESYAASQTDPSGHILALVSAQLFADDGSGATLVDEGVVLIQINFDIENRTIAPEALASFLKFDFSVADPNGLGADDQDFITGPFLQAAYVQALLASANIAFASGLDGIAVFPTQAYTVTIRQGVGDTVTIDVGVDFTTPDPDYGSFTLITEALGLNLIPGNGPLAFFAFELADVYTINDLTNFSTSGTARIYGFTPHLIQTLGAPGAVSGLAYAQIEVNFNTQTIGGPGSFIVYTAAPGGQQANAYVPLNQPVPFNAGLFNMAFYPLGAQTNSGSAVAGQTLIAGTPDAQVIADIAAILRADTGAHLYSEVLAEIEFFGANFALTSIPELDALGALLGTGAFMFDGSLSNINWAQLENPVDGDFFGFMNGQIDISFGDRTIGGGESFVSVDVFNFLTSSSFQFVEFMNATSFDAALGGQGLFAFSGDDFSGNNIQSLIFMIRSDFLGNPAQTADMYVNFTDGNGNLGLGELKEMVFTPGAACYSLCP